MRGRYVWVLGSASLMLIAGAISAMTPGSASTPHAMSVKPNHVNMLDCNGHSPKYQTLKAGLGGLCTDPIEVHPNGTTERFEDNGVYIGHDEPSVKFISHRPGSGTGYTFHMRLPIDPQQRPTATSTRVSKFAELSPAPWFGLPICDAKSYPQNPCTPDSDSNSSVITNPNAAGSAFLELQFYAPGFKPFIDGPSCDRTRWCAALTIDSLECTFGFATCNANCEEPVNFAYLQRNGVPAGPPSPQLTDVSTFTPNRQTLMMNQGDVVTMTMRDTPQGLLAEVRDHTTHQRGFIVASAANGFMHTNIADCSGTPFSFHPEYNTARKQNQVPWAALEGGVLMQTELGHFETCSSLSSRFPVSASFADGQSFSDPRVFQVCKGGLEPNSPGEGPCNPRTGVCQNATTEGGAPCPSNKFTSGMNCEFSGANCMPAGPRQASVNGNTVIYNWPVAGCQEGVFQNGDLDFDGNSYRRDWPDGTRGHPTSFEYVGPFTTRGKDYRFIQFETNVGASESLCDTSTGAGCTHKPVGAHFYPFFTLGRPSGPMHQVVGRHECVWNFGNVIAHKTERNFGRLAQYGTPDVARFAGTSTSVVRANPQLHTSCR